MTVFHIFQRDLKRIGRNAMALVVAVGISVIPALYAWFNIAANWDPYGSTSGIQVAVANLDEGTKVEGFFVNIGEQIITNLKGNDQIGWKFMDADAVRSGVESGRYYAGIVIPNDFSEKLSSILTSDIQRPNIEYYINEKKNAIAPKITDKGVSAVQQQVNEAFSNEVAQAIVVALGDALTGVSDNGGAFGSRILERLTQVEDGLDRISKTIDVFLYTVDSADDLNAGSQALLPQGQETTNQAHQTVSQMESLLTASREASRQVVDSMDTILDQSLDTINLSGADAVDILRRLESLSPDVQGTQDDLKQLQKKLNEAADELENVAENLEPLEGTQTVVLDILSKVKTLLYTEQKGVQELAQIIDDTQITSDSPVYQMLVTAGKEAGDLSKNVIEPTLEQKRKEFAATNPGSDPSQYTQKQKALSAEINALELADTSAQLIHSSCSEEGLTQLEQNRKALVQNLNNVAANLNKSAKDLEQLKKLVARFPDNVTALKDQIRLASDTLNTVSQLLSRAQTMLEQGKDLPDGMADELTQLIQQINTQSTQARQAIKSSKPALDAVIDSAYTTMESTLGLLTQFSDVLPQANDVLNHIDGALNSTAKALNATKELVVAAKGDVQSLRENLESVTGDQRLEKLAEILRSDATQVGAFMGSPVQIDTHSFFPISNYGSAMAAFYSILACWVGGIVLVAILKVQVDPDDVLKNLKPWECYIGRYLLFLIFGLIQSTIISLGDIYFLGVQCTSIPLFLLGGWISSFVFTLIIYTLTVSFGDIGKALAVVLLVIQIAGSGGTFPIEVTPEFFQRVYPFLPFTHAINAMREIIAGQYGMNYWLDLLKLLIFVPLALLVGLVLRKPLIRINAFFQDRLESTHLM